MSGTEHDRASSSVETGFWLLSKLRLVGIVFLVFFVLFLPPFGIPLAMIVGGLYLVYGGFNNYRVAKLLENTPPESPNAVAVGRTELNGEVQPAGRTFEQPFTEGECVYAWYTIEEYRPTSESDERTWQTIGYNEFVTPFYVQDENGQILVDASHAAEFEIGDENSAQITVLPNETPPHTVEAFLEGRAEPTDPVAFVEDILGSDGDRDQDETAGTEATQSRTATTSENDGSVPDPDQLSDAKIRERVRALQRTDPETLQAWEDGGDPPETLAGYVDDEAMGEDIGDVLGLPRGVTQYVGGAGEHEVVTRAAMTPGSDIGGKSDEQKRLRDRVLERLWDIGREFRSLGEGLGLIGDHPRRYTQTTLDIGDEVYVFGAATERRDAVGTDTTRLKIVEDPVTEQFIISNRGEEDISAEYGTGTLLRIVGGLLVSAFGLFLLLLIFASG